MPEVNRNLIAIKKCINCGELKSIDDFPPVNDPKDSRDGVRGECRKCRRLEAKKRKEKNLIKYKGKKRRNYLENRQYYIEKATQWAIDHPEKTRINRNKANKKKRSTPKGKLDHCMNTRLRKSIRKGEKGGRKWEELVGYTVDQLKKHLEKRFTDGMTWENYGTYWHIDHKTPISVFNFERSDEIDFRLCWSLKNLQPLEAIENMRKNKIISKPFQPSLAIGGLL